MVNYQFLTQISDYPSGRKFSLEFKFRYLANGKFARLNNSANYKHLKNFSIMVYITKTENSDFANIEFVEFDHSGQCC